MPATILPQVPLTVGLYSLEQNEKPQMPTKASQEGK